MESQQSGEEKTKTKTMHITASDNIVEIKIQTYQSKAHRFALYHINLYTSTRMRIMKEEGSENEIRERKANPIENFER